MDQRDAGRGRGTRAGECGVGVATHDHRVGSLGRDQIFKALLGQAHLLLGGARADAKVVVRARQLGREDLPVGHRLVVVLACVHEDLLGHAPRALRRPERPG